MSLVSKIELRNILLDIVITLLALQFIDISAFVEKTLSFAIYFIILVQSFALFLLLSDESFDEDLETSKAIGIVEKTKIQVRMWLRGFAMFAWIIGPLWILLPLTYLNETTGQEFVWAHRISMFIGIATGLVLFVRFFANSSDNNSEVEHLKNWHRKPSEDKPMAERIIIPVYNFFLYRNIGNSKFRYWLAYFITVGYLIYTETLFEVLMANSSLEKPLIILGVIGSYFPVRMLLLVKPPFSLFEVFSAFTAFGIFIYMIFS